MKYVYGPVPSRRLARSLGVDTIPLKTCNFSCVYCQLGRTISFTNKRRDFFPRNEIFQEIEARLKVVGEENIDYITFVGDGEPSLCLSLGWLIEHVHTEFSLPIAVITNGALLYTEEVREELLLADVVLPTLDAGNPKTFKKINRPHPSIQFRQMVDGMVDFRTMYSGKIWLEFMAVSGINDTSVELKQVRNYLELIKPDRVHINVPIRPPAESWVKIPSEEGLSRIKTTFKDVFEIVLPEFGEFRIMSESIKDIKQELVQIIKRHPMHFTQIQELLKKKGVDKTQMIVKSLEESGLIKRLHYENKIFFVSGTLKRGT
ncbi:MAG: radical SAM protein [Candidatus Helarchaeota archaeon]